MPTRILRHADHWLGWRRRHQVRSRWFHRRVRLARDTKIALVSHQLAAAVLEPRQPASALVGEVAALRSIRPSACSAPRRPSEALAHFGPNRLTAQSHHDAGKRSSSAGMPPAMMAQPPVHAHSARHARAWASALGRSSCLEHAGVNLHKGHLRAPRPADRVLPSYLVSSAGGSRHAGFDTGRYCCFARG